MQTRRKTWQDRKGGEEEEATKEKEATVVKEKERGRQPIILIILNGYNR